MDKKQILEEMRMALTTSIWTIKDKLKTEYRQDEITRMRNKMDTQASKLAAVLSELARIEENERNGGVKSDVQHRN